MNNQTNPRKIKGGLKLLTFVLLSPIFAILVILIIVLVNSYILTPMSNSIEMKKFEDVDKSVSSLYEEIKRISELNEDWVYKKSCEPDRSGPWSGGVYFCENNIDMYKAVNSASEITEMNNRYIGLISDSDLFSVARRHLPTYDNVEVVSFLASLDLAEKKTNIKCDFISNTIAKSDIAINGAGIWSDKVSLDNQGYTHMSVSCREKTTGVWYK